MAAWALDFIASLNSCCLDSNLNQSKTGGMVPCHQMSQSILAPHRSPLAHPSAL